MTTIYQPAASKSLPGARRRMPWAKPRAVPVEQRLDAAGQPQSVAPLIDATLLDWDAVFAIRSPYEQFGKPQGGE